MPVSKAKDQTKTKVLKKSETVDVSKVSKFNLPLFDLSGKKKGTVELPKELFGAKVNKKLMAQAVRVYLVNQRQGTASTKTRGEVIGSTRKIYRQKGTGRARHGSIKAPIFVGGGIVFGPRPRKFDLKLSKQMRRQALLSALSQKFIDQKISIVDADGATGKTKEFASVFSGFDVLPNKKADNLVLFISDSDTVAKRAARNISGVKIATVGSINTYEILNHKHLVFEKNAVSNLSKHFLKKE